MNYVFLIHNNYEKQKYRQDNYKMMMQKLQPGSVPMPMMTKIPQGQMMKPFMGKYNAQIRKAYGLIPPELPPHRFISPIQKM